MNVSIEISQIPRGDGTTASCRVSTDWDGGDTGLCIEQLQQAIGDCLRVVTDQSAVIDAAATGRTHPIQPDADSSGERAPAQYPRRATTKQIAAIGAIARRRGLDVLQLVRERFDVRDASELSLRQASQLIDQLKSQQVAS